MEGRAGVGFGVLLEERREEEKVGAEIKYWNQARSSSTGDPLSLSLSLSSVCHEVYNLGSRKMFSFL